MLLNYTTNISAEKTISEIQKILAKSGANAILTEYDDQGAIVALSFKVLVNNQPLGFRLPTSWQSVYAVLERQHRTNTRVKATKDQALRVAWRITKDWVEAQLALIESQMAKTEQIFLPYLVTNHATNETLYDRLAQSRFLLPAAKDSNETLE